MTTPLIPTLNFALELIARKIEFQRFGLEADQFINSVLWADMRLAGTVQCRRFAKMVVVQRLLRVPGSGLIALREAARRSDLDLVAWRRMGVDEKIEKLLGLVRFVASELGYAAFALPKLEDKK